MGKLTSFGVDGLKLRTTVPKYRKIMTSDSKLLPKRPEMGQVLSSGLKKWKAAGHSKFQTVSIYIYIEIDR